MKTWFEKGELAWQKHVCNKLSKDSVWYKDAVKWSYHLYNPVSLADQLNLMPADDAIEKHQTGHLLALISMNLEDEFEYIDLLENVDTNDKERTIISEASLSECNRLLSDFSDRLIENPECSEEYISLKQKISDVCLRYIVFYLGGKIMDYFYMTNYYDCRLKYNVRGKVFPLLFESQSQVSEEKWDALWRLVFWKFLMVYFHKNLKLIELFDNALLEKGRLDKTQVVDILKQCPPVRDEEVIDAEKELRNSFKTWCDEVSSQL